MTDKQIEKYLIKLVKSSNRLIKRTKMIVENKGSGCDLVTSCDFAVEKHIIKCLNKKFPKTPIVSEEFNNQVNLCDECFTIDPVDGTINFANGNPNWCIQVSYRRNGEATVGVIYIPKLKELYHASKGNGAYMNNKKITVKLNPINKCLWAIEGGSAIIETKKKFMSSLFEFSKNDRKMGSTGVDFALMAKGAVQAVIFLKRSAWDIEPGKAICTEAGAKFFTTEEQTMCAASDEFLEVLKDCLKKSLE